MEETSIELRQLLEEDRLANTPLLIMANKQDLMNALSPAELTTDLELHAIRDRVWHIVSCSAKTGDGLQEAMEWVVGQINSDEGVRAGQFV
jgi:signal recognition particle receptor subunit beta